MYRRILVILVASLFGIVVLPATTNIARTAARADAPPPATLASIGSLSYGGPSAPIIPIPAQSVLDAHAARLAAGATSAVARRGDVPGNFNGQSAAVGIVAYLEPNTYADRYYCGPGASRVLTSNWTNSVPSIDTLASQEQTDPNAGTEFINMVDPINSDANTDSFYMLGAAGSQATFDNWVAGDLKQFGRPALTALTTETDFEGNYIFLDGFAYSNGDFTHIIDIHGFNFSDPASKGDNFYYVETTGTEGGTNQSGKEVVGANKMWSFVQNNNAQIF